MDTHPGPYPAPGLVRVARRIAGLSQRQVARAAGLSSSTVARIEAGTATPSLDVLQRILAVAGLHLVAVDRAGQLVRPMRDIYDTRDDARRRYPAHFDVVLDPKLGEWWADEYGVTSPPETFYTNRRRRDAQRRFPHPEPGQS
jgi:transcriptional regulator with XRE-family HTH domain